MMFINDEMYTLPWRQVRERGQHIVIQRNLSRLTRGDQTLCRGDAALSPVSKNKGTIQNLTLQTAS